MSWSGRWDSSRAMHVVTPGNTPVLNAEEMSCSGRLANKNISGTPGVDVADGHWIELSLRFAGHWGSEHSSRPSIITRRREVGSLKKPASTSGGRVSAIRNLTWTERDL